MAPKQDPRKAAAAKAAKAAAAAVASQKAAAMEKAAEKNMAAEQKKAVENEMALETLQMIEALTGPGREENEQRYRVYFEKFDSNECECLSEEYSSGRVIRTHGPGAEAQVLR